MPHPYANLEGTPLWSVLEEALRDLVVNQDIVESTARPYIIGYICQRVLRVEDCLRLRIMYDLKLGRGPYPTSEVSSKLFPGLESLFIQTHLADVAGIASHGDKLLHLEVPRRDQFRMLVSQTFEDRWPEIDQKITLQHTPILRQLMNDTEAARALIKEILTD